MAAAGVLDFTDANFDQEVIAAEKPVLVDFWAPWCGPCKILAPVIDKLATETADRFRVGKCNTDDSPGMAAKYGINGIPTVLIFNRGEVVNRFVGVQSKDTLVKALEKAG